MMPNYIRAIAEHSILDGKIKEFKELAAEIIYTVEATEPDTLSYEWFLTNDETKCYVVQLYKDSGAALFHLRNIRNLLSPFHEVAPLTDLMIFGSLSDELIETIEPIGAKIFEHWDGVTR